MEDPEVFDLALGNETATVSIHQIKTARIFHVVFRSNRKPLHMTIGNTADGEKFWTSVPEGRQDEAEFVGKAVSLYIREYRRIQACVITTAKKSPAPSLFD
jgi:hypothetical protein